MLREPFLIMNCELFSFLFFVPDAAAGAAWLAAARDGIIVEDVAFDGVNSTGAKQVFTLATLHGLNLWLYISLFHHIIYNWTIYNFLDKPSAWRVLFIEPLDYFIITLRPPWIYKPFLGFSTLRP